MKLQFIGTVAATLLLASHAFVLPASNARTTTALQANKINGKVQLDSPKVVNMEELKPGDKKVFCRCWLSGTFPLCDGAHAKHNEATGDNVGPLIVSTPKASS